jgi:hypothetical protein
VQVCVTAPVIAIVTTELPLNVIVKCMSVAGLPAEVVVTSIAIDPDCGYWFAPLRGSTRSVIVVVVVTEYVGPLEVVVWDEFPEPFNVCVAVSNPLSVWSL